MFEDMTSLLKLLPLPWLVCFLSWILQGYVVREMWKRGNDLQDKNLADVKDSAEKLAALNMKVTDTLDALVKAYKGGKRHVR